MSRLSLLCLLALLPADAFAKQRKRAPVAPRTSAVDRQAFEQTYMLVFLQAGNSFLKDEPMPDPRVLVPFLDALKGSDQAEAALTVKRLEELIGNAECVQSGPGIIAPDAYKLMVGQVARSLSVGAIIEESFVPNNRASRSLDNREKGLVAACQGEARNQAYDRRGYYQHCLGRLVSESVYFSEARLSSHSSPQPDDPACGRVLAAVAADKSRFAPTISEDLGVRMREISERLAARAPASADGAGSGAIEGYPIAQGNGTSPANPNAKPWKGAGSVGRALDRLATDPSRAASDLTQSPGLKMYEPPLNSADLQAGSKLARVAVADEIGFTGYCYSYVKSALQKAGIVSRASIDAAGAGGHAKQFSNFVKRNPGLLKRKLNAIENPAWPLPIGSVVVWSPKACGYSATSGHIEIVTRIKPPQACSDGCGTFQVACLNELGAAAQAAIRTLPRAKAALEEAQAAYAAAAHDPTSKRVAGNDVNKKKRALAAVEARTKPMVEAFVVERQPAAAPAD